MRDISGKKIAIIAPNEEVAEGRHDRRRAA